MWIFTTRGFFSAVQDSPDKNMLTIRARSGTDLGRLVTLATEQGWKWLSPIQETPERDYRWRIALPRVIWSQLLDMMTRELDYPNFKNAVALVDKKRAHDYLEIWAVMAGVQEREIDGGEEKEAIPGEVSDLWEEESTEVSGGATGNEDPLPGL